MMTSTWIVVAHEAGARFFENRGRGTGLELVEEVEHAEGRARDRDMASDRPGRSFRKNSGDPGRASMGQSEGPHDRAVSDFARALVMASLDKDLAASKRDEIVERLGDLITL